MWRELIELSNQQQLRQFKPLITEINRLEPKLEELSDSELCRQCGEYRLSLIHI